MNESKSINEKMLRVAILGHAPLPFENKERNYAPGNRTWHFAYTCQKFGCNVLLIACRISSSYDENAPQTSHEKLGNIEYYSVDQKKFENKGWLEQKIQKFDATCLIGVTAYPSSIAAELNLDLPFWVDLYGSAMAEAQVKAFVYDEDLYLHHFLKQESKVLSKADVFSVVSEAQGFSLVGELGIWGRLNKNTLGYRFVRMIPATAEIQSYEHTKNVIRGKLAKDSDFVILYTGGYNTWTDVKTLFYGLEEAMQKNPNIVFVSTGGQISGHDDYTYQNFKALINSSKFKKRFHLCGWVPQKDLQNYYLESDIGINVDKFCYEAILGSRTRVLDWMRASLTFISTPLSEITNYLIENDLAYGFSVGKSSELANKILEITNNKTELEGKKSELKKILSEEFTYEATSHDLIDWLSNPTHAPDHGKISKLVSMNHLSLETGISKSVRLATIMWSPTSSVLKKVGLQKYENKIKKFGENILKVERGYNAEFLECMIPPLKKPGKYTAHIKIKNTGTKIWKTPEMELNPVNLSYRWKFKDKFLNDTANRVSLSSEVKSEDTVELELEINVPRKVGECLLVIDMVKENKFWFSDRGSIPFRIYTEIEKI